MVLRPRIRSLTIMLVGTLGLIMAGAGGWFVYEQLHGKNLGAAPILDGPTLGEVLLAVTPQVVNATGGPWALFSVYGIAADAPFSPNVLSYPNQNVTVNSCGHAFNGVTLWNGSIPTFSGTFDSGTAPFWQLAYYSDSPAAILLVTDINTRVTLFSPLALSSPCHPWGHFYGDPSLWTSYLQGQSPDSSNAADAAYFALAATSGVPVYPAVEIVQIGPGVFDALGDSTGAFQLTLLRCGEAGVGGETRISVVGANYTGQVSSTFVGSTNCGLLVSGHGAGDASYLFRFGSQTSNLSGASFVVSTPFQVATASPNGTIAYSFDAWGLANWMVQLSLRNGTSASLPLASSGCPTWAANLTDCASNASGWYAVVISSYGNWIDSYSGGANGQGHWSVPVDAIVSKQTLVILMPSSWQSSVPTLELSSDAAYTAIYGNLTV